MLEIKEREIGDVVVVSLSGVVVLGEGDEELMNWVQVILDRGGRKIVLNMTELRHVDGAGLGILVRVYSLASKKGARLRLSNLPKNIHDLLAITKLLTVFDGFLSEEEAIESLL